MNSEKMTAKDIADDVQQTVEDCSNSYRSTIQKRIEELVQSELEELWKELATAKREIERLEQFEETYTRQAELLTASIAREDELEHQLASVKSELEKVKGEREAEGYEFMRISTENKRLHDVVEGIKESLFELNNDTSFEFVIGKVYESIKLIASLETK